MNPNPHSTTAAASYLGRALAEVITDMQCLSQKIDAFCLQYELARLARQPKPTAYAPKSTTAATQPN